MNNVKIIYFNIDTIDNRSIEGILRNSPNYVSSFSIKPGLLIVNFRGTAHELFQELEEVVKEKNILIHDLDSAPDAFWGYMNNKIWDWLKSNRN